MKTCSLLIKFSLLLASPKHLSIEGGWTALKILKWVRGLMKILLIQGRRGGGALSFPAESGFYILYLAERLSRLTL